MTEPSPAHGETSEDVASSPAGEVIPRWSIRPEPTDEEMVALVTTLTVALAQPPADAGEPATAPSRWARAGRLAALTRWPVATGRGWGRAG